MSSHRASGFSQAPAQICYGLFNETEYKGAVGGKTVEIFDQLVESDYFVSS
jgi:hypothetical protein